MRRDTLRLTAVGVGRHLQYQDLIEDPAPREIQCQRAPAVFVPALEVLV